MIQVTEYALQCRCMDCGTPRTVIVEDSFVSARCPDCGGRVVMDPLVWGYGQRVSIRGRVEQGPLLVQMAETMGQQIAECKEATTASFLGVQPYPFRSDDAVIAEWEARWAALREWLRVRGEEDGGCDHIVDALAKMDELEREEGGR